MLKMLKRLRDRLPWHRPTLADLPREKQIRIRAMMLGAGTGAAMKTDDDGKIHVAIEEV